MLKYFKKQKGRNNATDDFYNDTNVPKTPIGINRVLGNNGVSVGVSDGSENEATAAAAACKRHSLRSTSSFCDEIFLEELANVCMASSTTANGGGGASSSDDDTISNGAISLGAMSGIASGAASLDTTTAAVNMMVGSDEDLFKHHSRLSLSFASIVQEQNCLSYFVQFLEKKNALSLLKFYLDTDNFKNAALAQLRKEHKEKIITQQIPEEAPTNYETATTTLNDTDDQIQNKQTAHVLASAAAAHNNNACGTVVAAESCAVSDVEPDEDNSNVPELKTLCDLTMRKPLTDDEKSQIYAETNKQINSNKHGERYNKWKSSSQLSLCSLGSNISEMTESVVISMSSVKDALAIYKKYLIQDAKQHIELPVGILSKISLIVCNREIDAEPCTTSITADCFVEAQQYVMDTLEKEYLNDFYQSKYYAKYCVELIDNQQLNINDILHSEGTLFYFMEYLEQQHERDCLDFWSTAINYRKSYVSSPDFGGQNEKVAQADAMIIYDKFFSLQNEQKLWSSNRLRAHVEACICTEGQVAYCFDLPLKVAAKYLERKYLKAFIKSSIFSNYVSELKAKIKEPPNAQMNDGTSTFPAKLTLRRCTSDKTSNRHRKTLSDCTLDKKLTISQHNTLLAAMDSQHHHNSASSNHLKQFHLNIDSSHITNPDLLWHRANSNNLKFGRVNSLGRYERDFVPPTEVIPSSGSLLKATQNWSLSLSGHKIKNAMRKLVHLPEEKVQEEIAWQVAEMIVKDVTNVTMGPKAAAASSIGCIQGTKNAI